MSNYSPNSFVRSFAERTLANLRFIEAERTNQLAQGVPPNKVSVFEVTQLMNSMVGLLIFPKAAHFSSISGSGDFKNNVNAWVVFRGICRNKEAHGYINTYPGHRNGRYDFNIKQAELTPKFLLLHLRNAVCHQQLNVFPTELEPNEDIQGFTFKDHETYRFKREEDWQIACENGFLSETDFDSNWRRASLPFVFEITLSTEEIRVLAPAFCEMLINEFID